MMRLAVVVTAVAASCLAAAALAPAASRPKNLWATVNVCDTPTYQNMMGVRASMPGDAQRTKMYMRFAAQYFSRSEQLWFNVGQNGLSKWIYVGSGIYRAKQGGYTFAFDPPQNGQDFVLRGTVDFKWVKSGRIIRTAHLNTKGGHPNTVGADPADYSSGLCQIT